MRYLVQSISVAAVAAMMGGTAFAQDQIDVETLTCAEFSAMTPEEQTEALEMVHAAQAEGDAAAGEAEAGGEAEAAADADAGPEADAAADAGGEAEAAGAEAGAAADAGATVDPEMEALMTACEGNDDALVRDQLSPM